MGDCKITIGSSTTIKPNVGAKECVERLKGTPINSPAAKTAGKTEKAKKPSRPTSAPSLNTVLADIANTKSTKYSASEILKALKQLTLEQIISLKDLKDDALLEAIIAILKLDPKQFEVGIVMALDALQHIPAGSIKANAAYAALAKIDPSKLTEANRQVIQAAKNKLEKTEADAARAEKQSAAAAIEQRQAAAALIREITNRPIARKDLSSDQLNALSSSLRSDQRIITFKDGQNEVMALIEWRNGKWQISVSGDSAYPKYKVDNQNGKISIIKPRGGWRSDEQIEAKLVVDSYWNDMEMMGMSYALYQEIWADQAITRSEFKKIHGAADADAGYNFFSSGGLDESDGTSAARPEHFDAIFSSLNKMTEGYGKEVKKQIFGAYVTAKGFVRVPTREAAGRILNGEENISATALLDQVGKDNKETAIKVIQIVSNNHGRLEIGKLILDFSQVERFLANMSIYAQSNVAGFTVDTSNIPKVTDPSGKTTRNIALLKDTEQFLNWLKGDSVEESGTGSAPSGNTSPESLSRNLQKLDLVASNKKGKPEKLYSGLKDNTKAHAIMFQYYLKREDYKKALEMADKMQGDKDKCLTELYNILNSKGEEYREQALAVIRSFTAQDTKIKGLFEMAEKFKNSKLRANGQDVRRTALAILDEIEKIKPDADSPFQTGDETNKRPVKLQQYRDQILQLFALPLDFVDIRDIAMPGGQIATLNGQVDQKKIDTEMKKLDEIITGKAPEEKQAFAKMVKADILTAKAARIGDVEGAEALKLAYEAQTIYKEAQELLMKKKGQDHAALMLVSSQMIEVYQQANSLYSVTGKVEVPSGKKGKTKKLTAKAIINEIIKMMPVRIKGIPRAKFISQLNQMGYGDKVSGGGDGNGEGTSPDKIKKLATELKVTEQALKNLINRAADEGKSEAKSFSSWVNGLDPASKALANNPKIKGLLKGKFKNKG